MKRKKLPDVTKAGRSTVVPYISGEPYRSRHHRRKRTAEDLMSKAKRLVAPFELILKISNEGHHWQFIGDSCEYEWWPSSAKMVINKQWHRGIHCHDIYQVVNVIRAHIAGLQSTPEQSKGTASKGHRKRETVKK